MAGIEFVLNFFSHSIDSFESNSLMRGKQIIYIGANNIFSFGCLKYLLDIYTSYIYIYIHVPVVSFSQI